VVLAVALVVALLANPLLAAGVESSRSDPSSLALTTPTDSLDPLTDTLPTIDLDDTETATTTSTPTPTSTSSTTESDDTIGEVTDTLSDTEDVLTTIVNDTGETVDDTVENASDDLDDAVNETGDTVNDTDETMDDTEETLENETGDALDDFEDETVNVTVEDTSAGETASVDVPPMPSAGVAFEDLAIEVQRDGGFELTVTSSGDTFDAPPLEGQPGTVPLGYVQLDHTISNENVGNVTVTFRVDAERVHASGADPGDIVLYRYSEGTWNELPTELVGTDGDQYVYRAVSPGLSEFATGAERPSFEVPAASVETDSVVVGDDVAVRMRIENDGGADGVYTAKLSFDGEVVDERDVSVAAGGTRVVTFREAVETPGTYAVSINDVQAGEVDVQPAGTTAPGTSPGPDEAAVGPAGGQPGFGPVVAFVALLAAGLFVLRRRN
jgi:PGF-CTERM protein